MTDFSYGEIGMTRFPPNVEQLEVRRESAVTWLIVRRNDLELKFPMNDDDCRHLAGLLVMGNDSVSANAGTVSPAA
jgi:hypothetical protein